MNRKLKRTSAITTGVALVIIGFNTITKVIESDINNSLLASQVQPQLVSTWKQTISVDSDDGIDRQKCAPHGHRNATPMGEEMGAHGLYQIWWYQESDGRFYREVSIMFGERCGVAYSEQFDEAITNRIPLDIARSLMVQFYRSIAEASGGIQSYRVQLLSSFETTHHDDFIGPGETSTHSEDTDNIEVSSVDLWALAQLGIDLPKDAITVVDIDDAWEYEYDPSQI